MSDKWPSMISKWGSKKPCSECKMTWVAGDKIYKINEEYWCANPDCPKRKPEAPKKEEPKSAFPPLDKVPEYLISYHEHAWEIALAKASKIYPPDVKEFEGVKVDKTLKDRMILAQVFYKGLMGVQS